MIQSSVVYVGKDVLECSSTPEKKIISVLRL